MKIYISGRISGNEKYYKEDFNWLEENLKKLKDIEPANPIFSIKEDENEEWTELMKKDIDVLKDCDAILLIKGKYPLHKTTNWKKSYGAKIERLVAKKYGLQIFYGWRGFQKWYNKEHKYDVTKESN